MNRGLLETLFLVIITILQNIDIQIINVCQRYDYFKSL